MTRDHLTSNLNKPDNPDTFGTSSPSTSSPAQDTLQATLSEPHPPSGLETLSKQGPRNIVYQPIMDDTYTLADDSLQTRPLSEPLHTQFVVTDKPDRPLEQSTKQNPSSQGLADTNSATDLGTATLVKTAKSEALTDSHILQESRQLLEPNERLADDHTLPGTNIEHMDVTTKQWLLTVNWHRTSVAKSGLINQLKGHKQTLDLDLSCLLCNRYGEVIERVWFKNMRDRVESVRHQGDELLGAKPLAPENLETQLTGSDAGVSEYADHNDQAINQERIALYLGKIPPNIFHVVMVVSSFTGHALSQAEAGHCALSDDEGNVILDIDLTSIATAPALWIATLTRVSDSWRFNADLQPLSMHQLSDIETQVSDHLLRTAK